jgi:hypothetical protein
MPMIRGRGRKATNAATTWPPSSTPDLISLSSRALEVAIGPQYSYNYSGHPDPEVDTQQYARATTDLNDFITNANKWVTKTGTVSMTNGSAVMTGSGTLFTSEFTDWEYVRLVGGSRRIYGRIHYTSNTAATLYLNAYGASGFIYPWPIANASGMTIQTWTDTLDQAHDANYYDRIASYYRLGYRKNDSTLLALCDTAEEYWLQHPGIEEAMNVGEIGAEGGYTFAPRQVGIEGIAIYALRNSVDLWDYICEYAYSYCQNRLYNYRLNTQLPNDCREPGYLMSFVGIALVGDNDSARVTRLLGALSDYILFWENTYDDVNAGWTIESFGRFSPDRSAHPFTTVHAGWGLIKIWQALSGDPTWSVTYATLVSRLSALIIKVADALVDAYVGPAGTWTVPWRSCLYWNSHTAVWAGSPPPPVSTPVRDYWFDVHNTVMAVNVGSATSTEIAQARQIGSMFSKKQ